MTGTRPAQRATVPTDRELLDTVLDMHRAAPIQFDGEDVCQHCTYFGQRETYFAPYPCPTRKAIEAGRKARHTQEATP